MSNFARGDRALEAIMHIGYEDPGVTIHQTIPRPDGTQAPGLAYPISDLVADLCHLAQRIGVPDIGALLDHGLEHYGAECVESAWQHTDDWDNLLEHPSNAARALTILHAAGVPERVHDGVLRKLGLG